MYITFWIGPYYTGNPRQLKLYISQPRWFLLIYLPPSTSKIRLISLSSQCPDPLVDNILILLTNTSQRTGYYFTLSNVLISPKTPDYSSGNLNVFSQKHTSPSSRKKTTKPDHQKNTITSSIYWIPARSLTHVIHHMLELPLLTSSFGILSKTSPTSGLGEKSTGSTF